MVPIHFAGPSPGFFLDPDPESRVKICIHYWSHSELISLYFFVQQFFDKKPVYQGRQQLLESVKAGYMSGPVQRPPYV
jgi:hypothetical protein